MNQEQCLVILGNEVGQLQPDVSIRNHYVLISFTLQSGGMLYFIVDSSSNCGARCLYGKATMMGTMFDYIINLAPSILFFLSSSPCLDPSVVLCLIVYLLFHHHAVVAESYQGAALAET